MELIPAARIHCAVLAGMHKICFADHWSEDAFAQSLAQPDTFGIIAVANQSLTPSLGDSGPAGMVLWRITVDEAEILTIAVLPPFRRSGLGLHLLQSALLEIRQTPASVLFLEVADNNLAAQALYNKQGFTQVGRRKGYYANTDALVMRLDL
jgi:ribosomal-protein-alanine N-acetyltransferase